MPVKSILEMIVKKASIAWSFFVDLLFPIECLGCGSEGGWLCAECLMKIKLEGRQVCQGCGGQGLDGRICRDCKPDWALDGVLAALDYDREISAKLVKTLKYGFIQDVSQVLARIFLKFHQSLDAQGLALDLCGKQIIFIPIPLHPKRLRWRGFNQSELIARPIAEALGGEMAIDLLARKRNILPQTQFKGSDRLKNVEGGFEYVGTKERVAGKIVILVDDVITTGATMNECAKALKASGASRVWGFVMARG